MSTQCDYLQGRTPRTELLGNSQGRGIVTQRVRCHMLGDAGMARRFTAGIPHGLIGDRPLLAALLRGKQVRSGLLPTPVFPEGLEQSRTKREVPADTALPVFHANHHALPSSQVHCASSFSKHFFSLTGRARHCRAETANLHRPPARRRLIATLRSAPYVGSPCCLWG
jgi:hypothetical protein